MSKYYKAISNLKRYYPRVRVDELSLTLSIYSYDVISVTDIK